MTAKRRCTFAQASNLVPLAKKKFKDAVLILEARPDEHDKLQPTGRWVAVKKDAVNVPNKGIVFTDTETMNHLQSLSA